MASELIIRDLYNGKYHMTHNPNAKGSSPRYVIETEVEKGLVEKTKPKGVTTILGQTLAKDFVGWALDCMEEYLQGKLPVITQEDLSEGKKESARRRDSGAGTGSETHAAVEHFLKGMDVDDTALTKEAHAAYRSFVEWFEGLKPTVVNVEEVVYSEKFQYAGTYDCMLNIDGKNCLCDLKTTNPSKKAPNGVYGEYFIQLGAYAYAHEEQRQMEEANGGSKLAKIDDLVVISAKKNGKLDIVSASDLGLTVEECSEMFKRVVNLFNFGLYTTMKLGGK